MVCNIVFAGGSCGMTMVRAGETLAEMCRSEGLRVEVQYLDLWTSDFIRPNVHLVVEMFPYYKGLPVPVVSGRPFLSRHGEDDLYRELIGMVREISSQS
jgi:hypothetical protein